ncbi:MAG: UDP-3-O-(3-hydroxymyristoyl)glucosamine N-acyltransferase [Alphaproteobacteria bacterium]|jgi:UDP-3-O-[3-hydroxymyristoyl] glucosamine N-acyltransferase|nr:UDP-3-O-(3-hydroxymyristoyl)glucosamine N-acyltransferase [Alphaproteobacteria bacterium]MDP6591322.1 UDP-3-O-(3-hydroxymyristoyl)glucosamine N-acyltransferase [Alphaproteobacteria bacterium]MDP6817546.1 UDP-3-O-(3-hydroxymyristoyl)glucosamine N-acyltransferase [Alphaproteobacteria bacterium]
MADPRFHSCAGPFTLAELAALSEAEMSEDSDSALCLVDVAPLDRAGPRQLSFLDNRKYIAQFEKSEAAACIVAPSLAARAPKGMALLLSDSPYRSYALAAQAFYPVPVPEPHIAETAIIENGARVDETCRVEHGVVIGAEAIIGKNCLIEANAVIGPAVEIGDGVIVGACASLSHCLIGDRTRIYPGARIGQDGFGFSPDPGGHTKVPQLGRVIVGEDVEIGANSAIDRGSGPDTIIGQGCWIDNLVQIGHNVEMGRGCVVAGMVAIAGSVKIGDFVFFGGQVGIAGHITVGSGAKFAGQSGITRDIPPGATMGGTPAVPIRDWHRASIFLSRLSDRDK